MLTAKQKQNGKWWCPLAGQLSETSILNAPAFVVNASRNVPSKLVFWPSFGHYGGFWGKNFNAVFGTSFPIKKMKLIFVLRHWILWKMIIPPPPIKKIIIFPGYFENCCVFWKNCYTKNIQTSILTKKFILIFVARYPLPLKMVTSFHKWFLQFFQHKLKNICEVFLLESVPIWKTILWRYTLFL